MNERDMDGPEQHDHEPRLMVRANTMVAAVIEMLADGKPRSAETIVREGVKREMIGAKTSQQSLYIDLAAYIQREVSQGRRPAIVQDEKNHWFRINHPVDDWPDVVLAERPRNVTRTDLDAIASRLHATASGDDPALFELAVCDAFAMLGFIATHIGGSKAPDGTLDAPLGPLGYRAILECKTAQSGTVTNARPEEPAKFRELYDATMAVLVGPGFFEEVSFHSELQVHGVSVWTVLDLVAAIENDVDLIECRELFGPGLVHDRVTDLIWSRKHGAEKRRLVLSDLLRREGFTTQRDLVGQVAWSDAPALTLDVAVLLVESALRKAGSSTGATRDEVHAAMEDLVRTDFAVRVPGSDGIVIKVPFATGHRRSRSKP